MVDAGRGPNDEFERRKEAKSVFSNWAEAKNDEGAYGVSMARVEGLQWERRLVWIE